MVAPFTFTVSVCACMHARVRKINVSTPWTLLMSFDFLHQPQILYFLKCLQNIDFCMQVYVHCMHMHTYRVPNFSFAFFIPPCYLYKLHKDLTSFSRYMIVCYTASSCINIFTCCACRHAYTLP